MYSQKCQKKGFFRHSMIMQHHFEYDVLPSKKKKPIRNSRRCKNPDPPNPSHIASSSPKQKRRNTPCLKSPKS